MTKLIFLRHGLSVTNKEHRFCGQMDAPLSDIGMIQAEAAGKYIRENLKIDKIYSSDLTRAYDTVKPAADALKMEITTRSDLREVDVGKWQGRLVEAVKQEEPEAYEYYKENPGLSQFPGGESYKMMQERALKAIEEIVKENDGKTVLIATHGGIIRVLTCAWTGKSIEEVKDIPHVANASLTIVNYSNGKAEFEKTDFYDYLPIKITEAPIK